MDKKKLIAEAVRLVKPGGIIAFTDWLEGAAGLSDEESERFRTFMKFPSMETLGGYRQLLADNGCDLVTAMDTGRFAPCIDLYSTLLSEQQTHEARKK